MFFFSSTVGGDAARATEDANGVQKERTTSQRLDYAISFCGRRKLALKVFRDRLFRIIATKLAMSIHLSNYRTSLPEFESGSFDYFPTPDVLKLQMANAVYSPVDVKIH